MNTYKIWRKQRLQQRTRQCYSITDKVANRQTADTSVVDQLIVVSTCSPVHRHLMHCHHHPDLAVYRRAAKVHVQLIYWFVVVALRFCTKQRRT